MNSAQANAVTWHRFVTYIQGEHKDEVYHVTQDYGTTVGIKLWSPDEDDKPVKRAIVSKHKLRVLARD